MFSKKDPSDTVLTAQPSPHAQASGSPLIPSPVQPPANMVSVAPPVNQALILICEKCGKKLAPDSENNLSQTLGLELKAKIKAAGGKGKIRAVVTGCLDVCPDGAIAIGISRANAFGDEFYTFNDHFETAADAILTHVQNPKSAGAV